MKSWFALMVVCTALAFAGCESDTAKTPATTPPPPSATEEPAPPVTDVPPADTNPAPGTENK